VYAGLVIPSPDRPVLDLVQRHVGSTKRESASGPGRLRFRLRGQLKDAGQAVKIARNQIHCEGIVSVEQQRYSLTLGDARHVHLSQRRRVSSEVALWADVYTGVIHRSHSHAPDGPLRHVPTQHRVPRAIDRRKVGRAVAVIDALKVGAW